MSKPVELVYNADWNSFLAVYYKDLERIYRYITKLNFTEDSFHSALIYVQEHYYHKFDLKGKRKLVDHLFVALRWAYQMQVRQSEPSSDEYSDFILYDDSSSNEDRLMSGCSISEAIDNLPNERDKDMIRMFSEGYQIKDIASKYNLDCSTVSVLIRQKIRKYCLKYLI